MKGNEGRKFRILKNWGFSYRKHNTTLRHIYVSPFTVREKMQDADFRSDHEHSRQVRAGLHHTSDSCKMLTITIIIID